MRKNDVRDLFGEEEEDLPETSGEDVPMEEVPTDGQDPDPDPDPDTGDTSTASFPADDKELKLAV